MTTNSLTNYTTMPEMPADFTPPAPPMPPLSKCQRIQEFFAKIRRDALYSKNARRIPVAIQLFKATFNAIKSQAFANLLQAMGAPGQMSGSSDWANHPEVNRMAGRARLFAVAAMIVSVYTIIEQIIEVKDEAAKGRAREGIDASLRIVEAASVLGDSIGSFTLGLSMSGIVQASQALWATPLAGISTVFSIASLVLEYRGLEQSLEIRAKLNGSARVLFGHKPLNWLRNELTNSEQRDGAFYLRRHFEVINREKYSAQILHIIDNQRNEHRALIDALQKRISDKISSHKLAITSLIIGLIAGFILFSPYLGIMAFASLSVLGLSVAAVSAALACYKYWRDYRSVHALETKIDELCPFKGINPDWIRNNAPFAVPLLSSMSPRQSIDVQANQHQAPQPITV